MPGQTRRQRDAEPVEPVETTPEAVTPEVDDFDWDSLADVTRAVEYTRSAVAPVDKAKVRETVPAGIRNLIHASYASYLEGLRKGEVQYGEGHRRAQILASQVATRHTDVPNRERGELFLKHARTYADVAQIDGEDTPMTVRGDVDKAGTLVTWRAKPKETRARK